MKAVTTKPAFMIHTGDITHLSKPDEFDNADQVIGEAKLDVHYVPGEHDSWTRVSGRLISPAMARAPRARAGTASTITACISSASSMWSTSRPVVSGVWGASSSPGSDDLKDKSTSMPIVVFAHIPLWTVYADWGWGTDGLQALALLKRFGSVTVLNGHIHQIVQKVEGNMTFHTARSTAFPQPAPGTAPSPGPMTVPAEQLRSVLGIASVEVRTGDKPLAITDTPLAG